MPEINTSSTFVIFRSHLFDSAWESIMEKTKATEHFRMCVPQCPRFQTPKDTLNLCAMCLGEECTRSVLGISECAHCENFQ